MLTPTEINEYTRAALSLVLTNSTPAMLAAAAAGIFIALLQALTQIQDQGLPTAAKLFAVMAVLYGTYSGLASSLTTYGDFLFSRIASL
jgi:type III secretion protein S